MKQKLQAGVFTIGITVGLVFGAQADVWTREDVLPPVLALAIAMPLGWTGIDALRRR